MMFIIIVGIALLFPVLGFAEMSSIKKKLAYVCNALSIAILFFFIIPGLCRCETELFRIGGQAWDAWLMLTQMSMIFSVYNSLVCLVFIFLWYPYGIKVIKTWIKRGRKGLF